MNIDSHGDGAQQDLPYQPPAIVVAAVDPETGIPLGIKQWLDKIASAIMDELYEPAEWRHISVEDARLEQTKLLIQEELLNIHTEHVEKYVTLFGSEEEHEILRGSVKVAWDMRQKMETILKVSRPPRIRKTAVPIKLVG